MFDIREASGLYKQDGRFVGVDECKWDNPTCKDTKNWQTVLEAIRSLK